MNFDVKEIISATMVLFAVVDIIGSVPIIINLRKKAGRIQSEKTAIVAGILLILFLFIGKQLLNLFGVTVIGAKVLKNPFWIKIFPAQNWVINNFNLCTDLF